jgi:arginase
MVRGARRGRPALPAALREAGLAAVLGQRARLTPDVIVSEPTPACGPFGFINERALLQMVGTLHGRVRETLARGRFPLVYGADCAVLLAAVPALAEVLGGAGLVFIDGHEDATTIEASTTGEAANMEVAFLLGLTGQRAPKPLRGHAGVLRPEAIAMLGMRDDLYRRDISVPTIAGRVWLRPAAEVHDDPAGDGDRAARQVGSQAPDGGCTPTWMCWTGMTSAPAAPPAMTQCRAGCRGPSWPPSPPRRRTPGPAAGALASITPISTQTGERQPESSRSSPMS